ncbi:MAG: hypothetical protein BroJett025_07480 [Patescibacteria group bacterium]|nr:MAG: hypothetical protein BroJett025_07480 [Patescibacteria group bacterium]
MQLKIEDTVVVNADKNDILIVSFLEAIYDDEKNAIQAQAGAEKCFALIAEKGFSTPAKVIVDLRPMGSKSHISPKAREVYMKFVSDQRIAKVAVLGSSDAQVSIANFILTFTGDLGAKLAWFSSEAEARYWIQK